MTTRIVVIDNDPKILDAMQEALTEEGFEVAVFEDTKDILGLVKQYQPHLIITDYILEGINGGELCRQLKSNPETANLPVIICSAYSNILNSLGFYGCDAFLAKPFELTDLVAEVELLLRQNYMNVVRESSSEK